ncbi:hypothetical protein [Bordetella sp. LUAb4]|uniref:hypothetical protein n=1 Tax=Bordetella sp. LUAb4 TaxID=2843195 RepID=UPI001E3E9B22|nr:hypothetical protein [Bordetella sp. LUAb4]
MNDSARSNTLARNDTRAHGSTEPSRARRGHGSIDAQACLDEHGNLHDRTCLNGRGRLDDRACIDNRECRPHASRQRRSGHGDAARWIGATAGKRERRGVYR